MGKNKVQLKLPEGHNKVLLHSCCAPCSCAVMDNLLEAGIDYSVFFYNPNIHPKKEYELRKEENKQFAAKHNIPFFDADYDKENWFVRVKGMEHLPERDIRCAVCFDMRLERTALFAHENGFSLFTSALAASRWKDLDEVNNSGTKAAKRYDGLTYWEHNWRKYGNQPKMLEISKQEEFYQQEYCGCAFSLRDANQWREENGREKIKIGIKYYTNSSQD